MGRVGRASTSKCKVNMPDSYTERYAFGGEEFRFVSRKREGGRGGGAVGGRFCIGSLVPSLCVPEGAKIGT